MLSSRDFMRAIIALFPAGELVKHAKSEGAKACSKYVSVMSSAPKEPTADVPAKKTPTSSRSSRAGLNFPINRIGRYMRAHPLLADIPIAASAPTFAAAVLEYLSAELLELSGNNAADHSLNRIGPKQLQDAIRADDELRQFLANVVLPTPTLNPVPEDDPLSVAGNFQYSDDPIDADEPLEDDEAAPIAEDD